MTWLRGTICFLILIVSALDAAAQAGAAGTFRPSRQLFDGLFPADPRGRLRSARPPGTATRERPANRECPGCEDRPGMVHFVIDSLRLTDFWLARHDYQANGGDYGDNGAIADFWYDAVHRRLFSRSLVLHEVDDPADLRLGRAPGVYPDRPDFHAELNPGTTVGHVGFVRWGSNGFRSYFAAVQGAVRDSGTGYLDLSTITGASGTTRSGSRHSPEDLVKHVRLHPSGQLEIGFDTGLDARPAVSLLVRGDAEIEGSLLVGGSPVGGVPPPPVLACSVRTASGSGRRSTSVACGADYVATGGGGTCASGEMRGSRPQQSSGEGATGWELTCSKEGAHTAYVICCAR